MISCIKWLTRNKLVGWLCRNAKVSGETYSFIWISTGGHYTIQTSNYRPICCKTYTSERCVIDMYIRPKSLLRASKKQTRHCETNGHHPSNQVLRPMNMSNPPCQFVGSLNKGHISCGNWELSLNVLFLLHLMGIQYTYEAAWTQIHNGHGGEFHPNKACLVLFVFFVRLLSFKPMSFRQTKEFFTSWPRTSPHVIEALMEVKPARCGQWWDRKSVV